MVRYAASSRTLHQAAQYLQIIGDSVVTVQRYELADKCTRACLKYHTCIVLQ